MPTARLTVGQTLALAGASAWFAIGLASGAACLAVGSPALLLVAAPATALGPALVAILLRRGGATAVVTAGASALLLLWAIAPRAPAARATSAVQEHVLAGVDFASPWFGAIPEDQLVRFGAWLGLTPTERRSALTSGLLQGIYDEIEADTTLPHRTSHVLDAWLFDRQYYQVAVPPGDGPFPLVVFLHGHGGPFQFYPHLWARAAQAGGVAFAFPSWGFGDWQGDAAHERIARVRDAVIAAHPIDPARVFLAGLSAGAIGALRHFAAQPRAFRGCIAISGVLPSLAVDGLIGARILLLHGRADERIPVASVTALAERLRAAGAHTETRLFDADHFLLLTHRHEVVPAILEWVRQE